MWLYIIQLKLKQIEQSRPGIWVSVIWPLEEDATYTLPRPQGTHAGQLPANTAMYQGQGRNLKVGSLRIPQ